MIDDFAQPAWCEAQESFAAQVAAGLARLVRWGRARSKDSAARGKPGGDRRKDPATLAIAPELATSAAAQYCLGEYYRELGERFEGGFDPGLSVLPSLAEFARPRGGYSVERLETNKTPIEAQRLYRSSGYAEVPAFNDEPCAHHWFEKALHRETAAAWANAAPD